MQACFFSDRKYLFFFIILPHDKNQCITPASDPVIHGNLWKFSLPYFSSRICRITAIKSNHICPCKPVQHVVSQSRWRASAGTKPFTRGAVLCRNKTPERDIFIAWAAVSLWEQKPDAAAGIRHTGNSISIFFQTDIIANLPSCKRTFRYAPLPCRRNFSGGPCRNRYMYCTAGRVHRKKNTDSFRCFF